MEGQVSMNDDDKKAKVLQFPGTQEKHPEPPESFGNPPFGRQKHLIEEAGEAVLHVVPNKERGMVEFHFSEPIHIFRMDEETAAQLVVKIAQAAEWIRK